MQCACAILSCGLPRFKIFLPHFRINGTIFEKKVIGHKMCFDLLYKFCLKHFSFKDEMNEILSKMYIGLQLQYPVFSSDFN